MTKYFTNTFPTIDLYEKASIKSQVVTQIIYGESFSVTEKKRKWLKIKIKEDNYIGYIKNKKFQTFLKSTHKCSELKTKVYKFPNNKKKITELTFNSKIKITNKKQKYLKFEKGWVNKKDIKPLNYKEKNFFNKIKIFKNIKYKWGGKSFKGIDCSALIQICLNFNNKYCPRDAKDQVKYFKNNIELKKIKINDVIYWKGHVAVVTGKNRLIHAYGPVKKTVQMNIDETIKRIKKTANLKVIGVKRI